MAPLRKFWEKHSNAEKPLRLWVALTKAAVWKTFSDARRTFPATDIYKALTIFDIGGNKFRLIAQINYKTGIVYVHHILTHKEYDKGDWKED